MFNAKVKSSANFCGISVSSKYFGSIFAKVWHLLLRNSLVTLKLSHVLELDMHIYLPTVPFMQPMHLATVTYARTQIGNSQIYKPLPFSLSGQGIVEALIMYSVQENMVYSSRLHISIFVRQYKCKGVKFYSCIKTNICVCTISAVVPRVTT